jgi:GH15 family glucan-1,4-alpha-glucosidase
MLSTVDAIARDLGGNGLIYRYRVTDGLEGDEGCFGICNFWMVDALACAGRRQASDKWMNSMPRFRNSLGLWSEEIEPVLGTFLGNYAQAFTHVGLINAGNRMSQSCSIDS